MQTPANAVAQERERVTSRPLLRCQRPAAAAGAAATDSQSQDHHHKSQPISHGSRQKTRAAAWVLIAAELARPTACPQPPQTATTHPSRSDTATPLSPPQQQLSPAPLSPPIQHTPVTLTAAAVPKSHPLSPHSSSRPAAAPILITH
jgi:hypothetical protein